MINVDKYEQKLTARRDYLDKQLHKIEDQLDETPNPDWDDNAAEHEGDEVLEDLGIMGQSEIRAINAALDRIEAGTFGVCVKCGEDISPERLDLLPYTPFCKNDAPN